MLSLGRSTHQLLEEKRGEEGGEKERFDFGCEEGFLSPLCTPVRERRNLLAGTGKGW